MRNRGTADAAARTEIAHANGGIVTASRPYEWRDDPTGSCEQRYFSHGQATNLVLKGGVVTFDDLAWADSPSIPRIASQSGILPTASE